MRQRAKNKYNGRYIYILNFGDYFSRLTAKMIRNLGGEPKIISFNTPFKDLQKPAGFILSGSPNGSIRIPVKLICKDLFLTNFPIMGVCVGAHLITRYFGGRYRSLKRQTENGVVDLYIDKRNKMLRGLKRKESVVMMHQDSIIDPGEGFEATAHTDRCPIAASSHRKWRWYNFQFHPELSPCGPTIFKNFLSLCYFDRPEFKPRSRDLKVDMTRETAKITPTLPEYEPAYNLLGQNEAHNI